MSNQPQQPQQDECLAIVSDVYDALRNLKSEIEAGTNNFKVNFVTKITSLVVRGLTRDAFIKCINAFFVQEPAIGQDSQITILGNHMVTVISQITNMWSSLVQASQITGQEQTYVPMQAESVTINGFINKLNAIPIRNALEEYCKATMSIIIESEGSLKFRVVAEGTLDYDTSIMIGRTKGKQDPSRKDISDAPNQLSREAVRMVYPPNGKISLVRKFSSNDVRPLNNGLEEGIKVYNIGPGYYLVFNWTTNYYAVVTSFEQASESRGPNGGGNIVDNNGYWFYTLNGNTYISPVLPEVSMEG